MNATTMTVTEALQRRTSIRAFLPTPVADATVREILDVARYAPSGGNLQPWKVVVVSGTARDAVVALAKNYPGMFPAEDAERPVYPPNLWEPYRSRRYQVGEDMYALLGIARDNKPARLKHVARNFEFFGAPVGVFYVIDERMGHGQWAHLGMYMQSVALAATERGLGTCFQEFWGTLRATLKKHFALPEHDMIYCGMALGHADPAAPVNRLRSARAPLEEFARFENGAPS
ncbi:MAG TPA: nitroreductase [Nevskiaceae bacterium]|nr:nitroreductase [Nevskiaceae bacterium]